MVYNCLLGQGNDMVVQKEPDQYLLGSKCNECLWKEREASCCDDGLQKDQAGNKKEDASRKCKAKKDAKEPDVNAGISKSQEIQQKFERRSPRKRMRQSFPAQIFVAGEVVEALWDKGKNENFDGYYQATVLGPSPKRGEYIIQYEDCKTKTTVEEQYIRKPVYGKCWPPDSGGCHSRGTSPHAFFPDEGVARVQTWPGHPKN